MLLLHKPPAGAKHLAGRRVNFVAFPFYFRSLFRDYLRQRSRFAELHRRNQRLVLSTHLRRSILFAGPEDSQWVRVLREWHAFESRDFSRSFQPSSSSSTLCWCSLFWLIWSSRSSWFTELIGWVLKHIKCELNLTQFELFLVQNLLLYSLLRHRRDFRLTRCLRMRYWLGCLSDSSLPSLFHLLSYQALHWALRGFAFQGISRKTLEGKSCRAEWSVEYCQWGKWANWSLMKQRFANFRCFLNLKSIYLNYIIDNWSVQINSSFILLVLNCDVFKNYLSQKVL